MVLRRARISGFILRHSSAIPVVRRMKTLQILALLTLTLTTLAAHAENWPQWRGPSFDGTSPETGLPTTWTRETVKWAAPMPGPSGASPIVWGDTVFVVSPNSDANLVLLALNRKD